MKNDKPVVFFLLLLATISLQAQIQKGADIDGEAAGDNAGYSVSMPDANTVAIGAYRNDGTGTDAGQTRVYTWSGSAWVQKGSDMDGETAGDESGRSVSMPDANTVAIGSYYNDGGGTDAGHVRVYEWSGSAWIQKGADIDGENAGDYSGYAVSMPDANTVSIGAIYNDGNGTSAGHVRVYEWSGSAWLQKGTDLDGEAAGDNAGGYVTMPNANTIAIGAENNGGGGFYSGHVRVYEWSGSAWLPKGSDIDGESPDDRSGAVSMPDANTVAIGAYGNEATGANAGNVRVYAWSGSAWMQKGTDIEGEATEDYSGNSVSMPDANTIAIGAPRNDGSGANAGHVRVYRWSGTAWVQVGVDIDGEGADDWSGYTVSMGDSNTVAIGSYRNDGTGPDAGLVRVYQVNVMVGFSQNDLKQNILTWPNPTNGVLHIDLGGMCSAITIIARNEAGQEAGRQQYAHAGKLQFTLPEAAGMYLIEITTEDKKAVLKVVKE